MDDNYNPNSSIFDKKYVPVFIEPEESIYMELLMGEQFQPGQKRSKNKLKRAISKAFKSIKRKIFYKSNKVKDADAKETPSNIYIGNKQICLAMYSFSYSQKLSLLKININFCQSHIFRLLNSGRILKKSYVMIAYFLNKFGNILI